MPGIPPSIRERWRYRLAEEGADRLHAVLQREDPPVAAMLRRTDGQRIARALEVLDASGRSILEWQATEGRPLIDRATARFIVIEPERSLVVQRIESRFDAMIENGAMEEVRQLAALQLDPDLPAMRAIGVRELMAAQAGAIALDEAIARAKIGTRQYSKRQATWFRNQFGPEWQRVGSAESAALACSPQH
jgi:tRNA dimethylallyltransferase